VSAFFESNCVWKAAGEGINRAKNGCRFQSEKVKSARFWDLKKSDAPVRPNAEKVQAVVPLMEGLFALLAFDWLDEQVRYGHDECYAFVSGLARYMVNCSVYRAGDEGIWRIKDHNAMSNQKERKWWAFLCCLFWVWTLVFEKNSRAKNQNCRKSRFRQRTCNWRSKNIKWKWLNS